MCSLSAHRFAMQHSFGLQARGVNIEAGVLAQSKKLGEIDPHDRLAQMVSSFMQLEQMM